MRQGVLMYSSDHPHAEFRFPESTSKVLAWGSLGNEVMRKMLWKNATRCFGERRSISPMHGTERVTAAIGRLYPGILTEAPPIFSNRCYDQIGISDYLVRRLRQITSLRCRCFTCHYRYR